MDLSKLLRDPRFMVAVFLTLAALVVFFYHHHWWFKASPAPDLERAENFTPDVALEVMNFEAPSGDLGLRLGNVDPLPLYVAEEIKPPCYLTLVEEALVIPAPAEEEMDLGEQPLGHPEDHR